MPNVSTSLLSFVKSCHQKKKKICFLFKNHFQEEEEKKRKKFQTFFPKNSDDVIKDFDFFSPKI